MSIVRGADEAIRAFTARESRITTEEIAGCSRPCGLRCCHNPLKVRRVAMFRLSFTDAVAGYSCGFCDRDGRVVGALRVELRLALPVSEMWETYLADHPEERVIIAHLCVCWPSRRFTVLLTGPAGAG